jgi:hypothetical protein
MTAAALVGMSFLENYNVTIDVVQDGQVTIEELD